MKNEKPKPFYAIPFFVVMALLMGCCFIPSLHPDKSMSERRELATFPEFSWESLASGAYFQDISTWFSDTFPGREGWLEAAQLLTSLHGEAEIMISGAAPTSETVPELPDDSEPLPVYIPEVTLPSLSRTAGTPTENPAAPEKTIRISAPAVTQAPTEAPTEIPTVAATAAPTEAPTVAATAAPTEAPTVAATAAPTAAPTEAPTVAATAAPTEAPTVAATAAPTEAPTEKATAAPTEAPTVAATAAPTEAPTEEVTAAPTEAPTEEVTIAPAEAPTEPEATQWQGATIEDGAEILRGKAAFQLDGAGYIYQNFSKQTTDEYAGVLNALARALDGTDITVVSAPPPTAVGILFEEAYQESLNSVSQRKILDYLNSRLDDRIVKVDTIAALQSHNSEYLFFRTDHHWTPLGAYYAYRALCESIGLTPVELTDMEEWNLGEFRGSLTGQVSRPNELRSDELIAYRPKGEITRWAVDRNGWKTELPLFTYWEGMDIRSKYAVFGADAATPVVQIQNDSLEDAPTCVILKDSFANCFIPFLTQSFRTIYALDYRYFPGPNLMWQLETLDPDYIISMPYITAIEDSNGPQYIKTLLFG